MKSDELTHPRLRYVDAFPVEQDGQSFFYLHDPIEVAESALVLSPLEFYIITMFDGEHSRSDIKLKVARRFRGILLTDEQLDQIITILNKHHYLDSAEFRDRFNRLQEEFHRSGVRRAWHAGKSYPEAPDALQQQLDSFYSHPQGAGLPAQESGAANGQETGARLQAILAPHIDLRVGGGCYTHAYRPLWRNRDIDLFIILGVAHYGGDRFFTACAKDFETPLGMVETDRSLLKDWQERAGADLTENDWVHRTEHSIEFQLLFLQHALRRPFKILPVLCGFVEHEAPGNGAVKIPPAAAGWIKALRETVENSGKRALYVLSVDLAHMGPKFGDARAIDATAAERIETADRRMFEVISRMDRPAFLKLMHDDLLARRVDACTAVYTLMSLLPGAEGKLLAYQQNFQEDSGSVVSYGSMLFYGNR